MIATWRGLAILAGIALALLVALFVVMPRSRETVDRSLWPRFDERSVQQIGIERGEYRALLKRAGDTWRFADAPHVAVDTATIDAILTAVRGGRWHRRGPRSAAGLADGERGRVSTTLDATSFVIGKPVAGTAQTWILRSTPASELALLVDNWIVAALTPPPLQLRLRQPLDCAGAQSISATTSDGREVRIEGQRLVEPHAHWLAERWLAELAAACAAIEFVAEPPVTAKRDRPGLRIVAGDSSLVRVGTCEAERALVDTGVGAGCVASGALEALEAQLAAAATTPSATVDPRPLPFEPKSMRLVDGTGLDVTKNRVGNHAADRDAVRELVRALMTPGSSAIPLPPREPSATLRAIAHDGREVALEIVGDAIGRAGEPALIRIDPAALAVILRPSAALRDATRWREDATTITSITIDGVTYQRGAVLGEWTRAPAGSVDLALVDALVEALASVRAPVAEPPHRIVHRLALTITPPVGTATTHTIELAPPAGEHCPGRVDGAPARIPLALCTAALALAASR